MKKIIALFLLAGGIYWITQTNDFAAWFNSDEFHRPIYSSEIDVSKGESSIHARLNSRYKIRHGFSLLLPQDGHWFEDFNNLDGRIKYTFTSNNNILQSETITIPSRPMMGLSDGQFEIILFTFDLPLKDVDEVELEVVVLTPITKLDGYKGRVRCEISPAYWPK